MLYYREHKLDYTYVYPGVLETLKAIRQRSDMKMAVLTNKPIGPSRGICDGLGSRLSCRKFMAATAFRPKSPIHTARACCWPNTALRPPRPS